MDSVSDSDLYFLPMLGPYRAPCFLRMAWEAVRAEHKGRVKVEVKAGEEAAGHCHLLPPAATFTRPPQIDSHSRGSLAFTQQPEPLA